MYTNNSLEIDMFTVQQLFILLQHVVTNKYQYILLVIIIYSMPSQCCFYFNYCEKCISKGISIK